jgi:H+/Cl- antiporter ClcA
VTPGSAAARLRLLALSATVGVAAGAVCALFLRALAQVTAWQEGSTWLWLCLPAWGLVLGLAAETVGRPAEPGMRAVLEDLADYRERVPRRLGPYVLLGTLGTHLFGGSAGREGTAVQLGAALARTAASAVRLTQGEAQALLAAGVAGGFAALFGTPLGGAVFALEVGTRWKLRRWALAPALVAAVIGDLTARALGASHGHFQVAALPLTAASAGAVAVTGVACAIAALGYVGLSHGVARWGRALLPRAPSRLILAGSLVVLAVGLLDGRRFLGLGLSQLEASLSGVVPPLADFALKLGLTALTVGAGFKGGEVTPLFASGALLGATLAPHLGLDTQALAAVGWVALFGAAAHTPLAATVMGVELFGLPMAWPVALACAVASLVPGRWSLYAAAPGNPPGAGAAGAA